MDRSVSRDSATAKPSETGTLGRQTFENIRFQMIANSRGSVRPYRPSTSDHSNRRVGWLLQTRLLVNPNAKIELPEWIKTGITKAGEDFERALQNS
jgi:hypothetical protein